MNQDPTEETKLITEKYSITTDASINTTSTNDQKKFLKFILLTKGTSTINFLTFTICIMASILFFTFITSADAFVLTVYLKIPKKQQGTMLGDLAMAQAIASTCMVAFWGIFSDRIGRKFAYVFSFIILGVTCAVYPFIPTFWGLIVIRVVLAFGVSGANAMLTCALGDYVDQESLGKAAGLLGIMTALGAASTKFVFLQLPGWLSAITSKFIAGYITYGIIALISFATSICAAIGLKGKLFEWRHTENKQGILSFIKDGLKSTTPFVILSYFVTFVARGSLPASSSFLVLYITQQMMDKGNDESYSLQRAGFISGVSSLVSVIAIPIMGIGSDKLPKLVMLTITSAISGGAFLWLGLLKDVTTQYIYPVTMMLQIGLMGLMLMSQIMIAKFADEKYRGTIAGIAATFGSLSIILCNKFGGYLYDHFSPKVFYYFFAGMDTALIFIVAFIEILVLIHAKFVKNRTKNYNLVY